MRKALCKSQPVAFLLSPHAARASRREESARDCTFPRIRTPGEALRACARGAGKNAYCVSSANEFRSGHPKARSNCWSHRVGPSFRKSTFHENRIHLPSQSRPFLLLPFARGTGPRGALLGSRGLSCWSAAPFIEMSPGHRRCGATFRVAH